MPVPAPRPGRLAVRSAKALLSPWSRFALLALLLTSAATAVFWYQPQEILADGWPVQASGMAPPVLFSVAYGICVTALAPRPVLNLAAGALFGAQLGTVCAMGGSVLAAGLSFGLGRLLGQEALRPLLRGRLLKGLDGQLSRHGFRSVLALRLVPGVPFAGANYGSAVSRMGWLPFLSATALGSIPNTAAYVVAGSSADAPDSPVFLAASSFIAVSGLAAVILLWCKRHRLRGTKRDNTAETPHSTDTADTTNIADITNIADTETGDTASTPDTETADTASTTTAETAANSALCSERPRSGNNI